MGSFSAGGIRPRIFRKGIELALALFLAQDVFKRTDVVHVAA